MSRRIRFLQRSELHPHLPLSHARLRRPALWTPGGRTYFSQRRSFLARGDLVRRERFPDRVSSRSTWVEQPSP